jgi:hypothetical protein
MKFKDILKKVGSSILREAVPGGGIILDAVNAMLPEKHKLPADATGEQARSQLNGLSPELQAEVLGREFDVEIEQIKQSGETARAMLEAEAASTHTTRPYIAKGAFHVVAAVTLVVAALWAYGVATDHDAIVGTVMEGWPFILALIGPFVALLHAYFGILRKEHKARVEAVTGSTGGGVGAILASIVKRK